jgi:hypothetical protein
MYFFSVFSAICGLYSRDGAYFSATRVDLLVRLPLKINNIYIYNWGFLFLFLFFI